MWGKMTLVSTKVILPQYANCLGVNLGRLLPIRRKKSSEIQNHFWWQWQKVYPLMKNTYMGRLIFPEENVLPLDKYPSSK